MQQVKNLLFVAETVGDLLSKCIGKLLAKHRKCICWSLRAPAFGLVYSDAVHIEDVHFLVCFMVEKWDTFCECKNFMSWK